MPTSSFFRQFITHIYQKLDLLICRLEDIEETYYLYENKLDGVIKVAIE